MGQNRLPYDPDEAAKFQQGYRQATGYTPGAVTPQNPDSSPSAWQGVYNGVQGFFKDQFNPKDDPYGYPTKKSK